MEINSMRLTRLKNEEHFQFHAEFDQLINRFTAEALKVLTHYTTYQSVFLKEKEALNIIEKSDLTDDIGDADDYRDSITRGIDDAVESATNHYSPEVREAASRIRIVLDDLGNIGSRPYNEESAAITSLVQKLRADYAQDVETISLTGWVNELEAANTRFMDLVQQRYQQQAGQTLWRMKEVRVEVDEAYRDIVKRINALMIVDGAAPYEAFVIELNNRIEKYTNIIKQRMGTRKRNDEPVA